MQSAYEKKIFFSQNFSILFTELRTQDTSLQIIGKYAVCLHLCEGNLELEMFWRRVTICFPSSQLDM